MRFNIGSRSPGDLTQPPQSSLGSVPSDHSPVASSSRRPPPQCPMHTSDPAPVPAAGEPSVPKCPIDHASMGGKGSSSNNPLNQIPANLSLKRQPNQTLDLPTERTVSTIPRPQSQEDDGKTWDYPSPQQFYNALVRKGWETPEDSVEMMVDIHNFLNEEAWQEVMKWEKKLPGGDQAKLIKFQGRPGEISPKAQLHLWAGKIFPSKFNSEPPFDRHDWVVSRPVVSPTGQPSESSEKVTTRYVIDYYSGPDDEDGNPVFVLDVRPALDSFESVQQRIKMTWEEWGKADSNAYTKDGS